MIYCSSSGCKCLYWVMLLFRSCTHLTYRIVTYLIVFIWNCEMSLTCPALLFLHYVILCYAMIESLAVLSLQIDRLIIFVMLYSTYHTTLRHTRLVSTRINSILFTSPNNISAHFTSPYLNFSILLSMYSFMHLYYTVPICIYVCIIQSSYLPSKSSSWSS